MVQPRLRARLQALALLVLLVLLTAGATGFAGDQDLFKKVLGPFATEEGNFRGGSWADYDRDGDLDLFVPRNMAHPGSEPWNNLLYRNDTVDGEASFTNVNAGGVLLDDPSSHSKTGLWGDYDNDGDLDLFVVNEKRQQDLLYENDGVDGFARITNGTALVTRAQQTHGAAWGDCNQDGLLDIGMDYTRTSDFLYINRLAQFPGNDSFTAIPLSGADGGGHSIHWVDVDEDGD